MTNQTVLNTGQLTQAEIRQLQSELNAVRCNRLEQLVTAFESPWLARTEDEWYINQQRAKELQEEIEIMADFEKKYLQLAEQHQELIEALEDMESRMRDPCDMYHHDAFKNQREWSIELRRILAENE